MNRTRWRNEIEALLRNIETDIDRVVESISILEKTADVAPKRFAKTSRWVPAFAHHVHLLQTHLNITSQVWDMLKEELRK